MMPRGRGSGTIVRFPAHPAVRSKDLSPMPNTASTKKRVRQTDARTLRNKMRRTAMRSVVRKVREAVTAGNKSEAQSLLQTAYKEIDKAARQHILHANTAANKKRKLAKLVGSV